MRLLVCGSHKTVNRALLTQVLDAIHRETPITLLIHGDAPCTDKAAGAWAESRGIPVDRYPAKWALYGRAAGPERNGRMLRESSPDRGLAFPGGPGTANMVELLGRAGVPVTKVSGQ